MEQTVLLNFEGKTEIFHAFQPDNKSGEFLAFNKRQMRYRKKDVSSVVDTLVIDDGGTIVPSRSGRYFFELQQFKVEIEK